MLKNHRVKKDAQLCPELMVPELSRFVSSGDEERSGFGLQWYGVAYDPDSKYALRKEGPINVNAN